MIDSARVGVPHQHAPGVFLAVLGVRWLVRRPAIIQGPPAVGKLKRDQDDEQ